MDHLQHLLNLLSNNPILYITFTFIIALLMGSFLNVVIYRTPKILEQEFKEECCEFLDINNKKKKAEDEKKLSLSHPSSTCPQCNNKIKPWHNIPVISYLLLKGKCNHCGSKISIRYPIIEFVTALLSVLAIYLLGFTTEGCLSLLLLWSLISLTMIDFDTYLLPDNITLPLLWLGLIINSFNIYTDFHSAFWGAIAGYLSLWSVFWLFKIITGKEGMGFGDFKLLAALGAWMGWQMLPLIIILSSLVGAITGIAGIIILGKDKNKPIPFGPYLAVAGWIVFFWGEQLIQKYFHFMAI